MTALTGVGTVVPLPKVEEELARQLNLVRGKGEAPVRHARMSNLVIFCDRADTVERLAAEVPNIVSLHPARVLLLLAEETAPDDFSTAVNSWCEVGTEVHICCEQIVLRAGGQYVHRLPFAVRGLLIGDLPTNVWWAATTPPALGGPLMHELTDRAQQILYDSIGWADPPRYVAATASWLARSAFEGQAARVPPLAPRFAMQRVASDLNWRRLKYWRRVLSQALDPGAAPGAIESISEMVVEHGPHAVIQAWELVSWVASRLGWKVQGGQVQPGAEIDWQVQAPHGVMRVCIKRLPEGPSDVRHVRFTCRINGVAGAIDVAAEDGRLLKAVAEPVSTTPRTVIATPQPLAELVARQLSDRDFDPVFNESMVIAKVFAESLLR